MAKKKDNKEPIGEKVTIEGYLYRAHKTERPGDIYEKPGKERVKFDLKQKEAAVGETISQTAGNASQGILQAVTAQAQNLGAAGCISLASAAGFQGEHIIDNARQAHATAAPLVAELIETGTIVPPEGSKYAGQEIPAAETVLGIPVGEYKKAIDAEKNLTEEEKQVREAFRKSMGPTAPGNLTDDEDGSQI
tara:strand:- start:1888 stop:2463 length:576 start_codon:yes stop_codon:yes gene_type:complete